MCVCVCESECVCYVCDVSSLCSVVGSALDMEDVAEKLPNLFKVRLEYSIL